MRVWTISYLPPAPPAFYKDEPRSRLKVDGPRLEKNEAVTVVSREEYLKMVSRYEEEIADLKGQLDEAYEYADGSFGFEA